MRTAQYQFLNSYLQNCTAEMECFVQTMHLAQLDDDGFIQALKIRYSIPPLELHLDRKEVSTYEKNVPIRELASDIRFKMGFNNASFGSINQTILRCHLPFAGDAALLKLDPMQSVRLSLPKFVMIKNEICFDVPLNPHNPEESKNLIHTYSAWFQQQIVNINTDLEKYNNQLKKQIDRTAQQQRQKLNRTSNILSTIDIPLRKEQPQSTQSYQPVITAIINEKYYSVAISYGEPNKAIATDVNNFLKSRGVKTWFFPDDGLPGEKLHRTMTDLANENDRVILLCSKASLSRKGVLNEIERVLAREANEGGSSILRVCFTTPCFPPILLFLKF